MAFQDSIGPAPNKMEITDLSNGNFITVQFNPTEFTHNIEVNYARQVVPGLSHTVLQYVNTQNQAFEMDLFFVADTEEQLFRNLVARRFLEALCYPFKREENVVGGGPPRALFVWPNFISLTTVITNLEYRYTRFTNDGRPLEFTVAVSLEEIRRVRLLSADILESGGDTGLQRAGHVAPIDPFDIEILDDE